MGKIKGWKKFVGHDSWRGSSIYRVVQVTSSKGSLGDWAFSVHGMNNPGEVNYKGLDYVRYTSTKQEAMSLAVVFMKRHPKG